MKFDDLIYPTADERNVINDCFGHRGGDGYNETQLIPVMAYSAGKAIVNADRDGLIMDPVTFGLIGNEEVNAAAALHPVHGYVVGLNVGLVGQLFQAASHMYPVPDATHPIGTFWFSIAQAATSFIIEHEFAHISNGHLLLHQKKRRIEVTKSHDDDCSESLSKLDIQTLEMDADACAVTRVMMWAVNIHRYFDDVESIAPPLRPFFYDCSEQEVLMNVLRAVTLAIVSLEFKDPPLEDCVQRAHLPRTARLFHAGGLMHDVSKKFLGYSIYEHFGRERLADEMDEVIQKVGGGEPINQDVLEFYLRPREGYIHTLTRNWRETLAPKLQELSAAPIER